MPGPQFPLYLLGRELEEMVPVAFLAPEQALAIAVMSYNGGSTVGLIGDYDAIADLDDLAVWISDEITYARRGGGPRSGRRAESPVST